MKARRWLGLGTAISFPLAAYVGYPSLVWVTAILRPRPYVTDPNYGPSVAVVIAAHNEAALISAKVRTVLKQDYAPDRFTCTVVCDGCTDDTADAARAAGDARLRVIEVRPQRGKLAAIHATIPHVRGEIIAFTDANALLEPDALRELVAPFADPSVVVVSGAKHVRAGPEAIYWRYERWIRTRESASGSIAGADGALYAVRATSLDASAHAGAADDLLISLRAAQQGGRIVFAPRARTTEAEPPSAARTFAARTRTISGALFALEGLPGLFHPRCGDLWWKLAGHKLLRIAAPSVMAAGLAYQAAPLSPARRWAWAASLVLVAAFLSAPTSGRLRHIGRLGQYALLANLAALAGVARFVARLPIDAWSPERQQDPPEPLTADAVPRRPQM